MKKLISLLITAVSLFSVGCQQQPAERIVVMEPYTTASISKDFTDLTNLIDSSDLILRGKVTKVSDLKFVKDAASFLGEVKFDYTQVYKGTPDKNKLRICTSGGYIPVMEYYENNGFRKDQQQWYDNLDMNEKSNGYVLKRFDGKSVYEEGKEYITFLRVQPDGSYYPICTGYGVLEVDGEYLNQTPNGHEFTVELVEQRLAEIAAE